MKLLMCLKCGDIFNLNCNNKSCGCGETSGRYVDDLNAEYSGESQPIGISNSSFKLSLSMQRLKDEFVKDWNGVEFTAFFIPKSAPSIKKIDK